MSMGITLLSVKQRTSGSQHAEFRSQNFLLLPAYCLLLTAETLTQLFLTARATSLCRKQVTSWSFTIPTACMKAYATVGPMNLKPSFLNSRANISDTEVFAGASR